MNDCFSIYMNDYYEKYIPIGLPDILMIRNFFASWNKDDSIRKPILISLHQPVIAGYLQVLSPRL